MIEPRIYRVAFAPAVLAVVLVMFSLQSSPRPLEQGLPADVVFEGAAAQTQAQRIVDAAPDRRAGTAGDLRAARVVAQAFRQSGFTVEVDRFERDEDELVNVVGRRAGESGRQIVVVADRDASGVPDAAGSASDTAALLQLARVFEGRPSEKTLVLASVDGSVLGQVGATRLMRSLPDPEQVDGIVTVSELGAAGGDDPPALVGWSTDTDRASQRLQRTAAESVREEVGARPRPPARWARWGACRSRSESVPRGCCWVGATTRCASPAGASARTPRAPPATRSTATGWAPWAGSCCAP